MFPPRAVVAAIRVQGPVSESEVTCSRTKAAQSLQQLATVARLAGSRCTRMETTRWCRLPRDIRLDTRSASMTSQL